MFPSLRLQPLDRSGHAEEDQLVFNSNWLGGLSRRSSAISVSLMSVAFPCSPAETTSGPGEASEASQSPSQAEADFEAAPVRAAAVTVEVCRGGHWLMWQRTKRDGRIKMLSLEHQVDESVASSIRGVLEVSELLAEAEMAGANHLTQEEIEALPSFPYAPCKEQQHCAICLDAFQE
eukprot:s3557_g5.t1